MASVHKKALGEYKIDSKKVSRDLKKMRMEKSQEHDSAQSISARPPPLNVPYSINGWPMSFWEHPGVGGQQASNAALSPCGSYLQTPIASLSRNLAQQRVNTRRQPSIRLNADGDQSALKRSGAVRIKRGTTSIARSASYQDSPVSARPTLTSRADTWGPSADYLKLQEEAEFYIKFMLGVNKYEEMKDSAEGDQLIQGVIQERLLYPAQPTEQLQNAQRERPASALTLHAPQPVRRAATYEHLLAQTGETPRRPVLRIQTQGLIPVNRPSLVEPNGENVHVVTRTGDDRAKTHQKPVNQPTENVGDQGDDDWADTYKLYQRSLRRQA